MNTTESPKRKISALERTIVAGMGSITMPDMMALVYENLKLLKKQQNKLVKYQKKYKLSYLVMKN